MCHNVQAAETSAGDEPPLRKNNNMKRSTTDGRKARGNLLRLDQNTSEGG